MALGEAKDNLDVSFHAMKYALELKEEFGDLAGNVERCFEKLEADYAEYKRVRDDEKA